MHRLSPHRRSQGYTRHATEARRKCSLGWPDLFRRIKGHVPSYRRRSQCVRCPFTDTGEPSPTQPLCSLVLSSYDDPVLWKGHSSMVEEMKSQLHHTPDAIFCSVGGGGLIGGILLGCQSVGWDNGSSTSQSIDSARTQCELQSRLSP